MANTGAWKWEWAEVDEVPLTRGRDALPMPWHGMTTAFEKSKKPIALKVPKEFWIKDRMVPDDEKAEGIASGRLKAAFAGYRLGVEKQRGELVGWGLAVVPLRDDDGNWEGHNIYIQAQNLEVRKEAIARARVASGTKAKKGPAVRKRAAKK